MILLVAAFNVFIESVEKIVIKTCLTKYKIHFHSKNGIQHCFKLLQTLVFLKPYIFIKNPTCKISITSFVSVADINVIMSAVTKYSITKMFK